MIGLSITLAAFAFMAAHAAILVQFIGTSDTVLWWLSVVQVSFLLGATGFILAALQFRRRGQQATAYSGLAARLSHYWQLLPGWLIFLCVLLIVTVLLGELSIFIARLQGNELSWLQHIPTLTVVVVCTILCSAWILRKR